MDVPVLLLCNQDFAHITALSGAGKVLLSIFFAFNNAEFTCAGVGIADRPKTHSSTGAIVPNLPETRNSPCDRSTSPP